MVMDSKEAKRDARVEVTLSEGPGRRQPGKFHPFRRLFGRKRRRETEQGFVVPELKPSHSTSDVCNGVDSGLDKSNQHLRL
ncbi:hypothetical protein Baya_9428 [Bagarius yarrelli]|uniref:Uncharacterized protein n=1 Tax=Bagarius yarrelli TaxID=175774 RepID=A0A556U6M8_BAGYA|nr:hypothetical protein Baya_9428 [Bagarius yarrelli]